MTIKEQQKLEFTEQLLERLESYNKDIFYIASMLHWNDVDILERFEMNADDLANLYIEEYIKGSGNDSRKEAFEDYRKSFKNSYPVIKWIDNKTIVFDASEIYYTKSINYIKN